MARAHCFESPPRTQGSVSVTSTTSDMEFGVILAAVLAVAHGGGSSPPATECSPLHDGHSLLSSLLLVLGFDDTCVAATLDYCASAREDGDFAALMEVRASRPAFMLNY